VFRLPFTEPSPDGRFHVTFPSLKGNIVNWSCDAGPEFRITAADGFYELNLPYPTRRISRT